MTPIHPRPSRAIWWSSLTLALALGACGRAPDARRIEGRWTAENFRVQSVGVPIAPDLSIASDSIGLSNPAAAQLDVLKLERMTAEGDEVTLQTRFGIDIVFAFENDDRMYFTVPFTQSRIYYRRVPPADRADTRSTAAVDRHPAAVVPPIAPPAPVAAVLPAMQQQSPSSETHYELAVDALRHGDDDVALRSLSTALESGFADWRRIDGQPLFDRLHDDMRFQVLRSRWRRG